MPIKPTAYALADGNWTKIADFSGESDQPRVVRVTNTGTAGQLLYAPAHLAPDETPDGGDIGLDLGNGSSVEIGSLRPGNGNILQIWAKGNGMAGKVGIVL